MFSVAIATANRRDDLKRSIGILRRFADIDDINVVSDSDPEVLTYEFLVSDVNISVEVLPRKEGPGRTKLVGISKCRHESVLVIDDDADLVKLPSKDLGTSHSVPEPAALQRPLLRFSFCHTPFITSPCT